MQHVDAANFLLASCPITAVADGQDYTLHSSELMVFDLVHGLGVGIGAQAMSGTG
jgi:hypothetical protein